MKRLVLIGCLLISCLTVGQNFESFASAIKINNTIYNTTGSGVHLIDPNPGAPFFEGYNLGVFGQNSTCARITGGEIKTWKTTSGNVCSANLYWRVYPSSSSPSGSFNSIPLSTISDCDTANSLFFDGLGPCSTGDQKWKDYGININFISSLLPGNYILEIYYDFSGSDSTTNTCETTKYVSNSSYNFKANFTISNPTCSPSISPLVICEDDTIQLVANPSDGIAPYTYDWSGPNGFTSNIENPSFSASLLSNGIYSLIITDSCGASSVIQYTDSITITPKETPTFNTFAPICSGETAPTLSLISTNGISGTWNPENVSNINSNTYTFTPDNGQCATTTTLNVTIISNITPTFNAIAPICSGETAPTLSLISTNGISGTWNPENVSDINSDTYTFTPDNGQCATTTTLNVTIIPNITPTFNAIAPICSGETAPTLSLISTNGISGTWNPENVSDTSSGTYTFTPDNGQCTTTTTLNVMVNNSPTDIEATIINVINESPQGSITINNISNGIAPFTYSLNGKPFTTETSFSNLTSGIYTIIVKDANGCEFEKEFEIQSDCFFPKGISPNFDGKNDTFNLLGCNVVNLKIYNRYGVTVNSFKNYSNQWTGLSTNGIELPDGTYFYVAEISDGKLKSGWVYLTKEY